MKIVITGGLGFIGSHLAVRLLNEGHKITIIDNGIRSTDYLEHLQLNNHKRLTVIKHDINQPLKSIVADQVYHFACTASPTHFLKDRIVTSITTTIGTYNVISFAISQEAPVFIASSSEIYGNTQMYPQSEECSGNVDVLSQRACYSEGKRMAETFSHLYAEHGHAIRIGRIFNTYGPGMAVNDGRVIPQYIVSALKGNDILVHGDGKQTRSFCYIDDMIEGIVRLMNSTGSILTPINLGNPTEEYTINEVAAEIVSLTNSHSSIRKISPPFDVGIRKRCPDIKKAKDYLSWFPEISFKEGVEKTIQWYKKKIM